MCTNLENWRSLRAWTVGTIWHDLACQQDDVAAGSAIGDEPNICYWAMDCLLEIEDELAEAIDWATADLLDLGVDLPLFDITSTYWATDRADPAAGEEQGPAADAHLLDDDRDDGEGDERTSGFRTHGKSRRRALRSHPPVPAPHEGGTREPGDRFR